MSGFIKSRLHAYLVVTLICGASALAIDLLLSSSSDLRECANRKLTSAMLRTLRTELAQVTGSVDENRTE